MASIIARGRSYCVRWRVGRGAAHCCCTFDSHAKALAAKLLAEAHHHRLGSHDVYLAVDPDRLRPARRRATPPLRDWVEQWLRLKIDVASSTHAEYSRILRRSVVPAMGHVHVDDLSRDLHLNPWKAQLAQRLKPATVRKQWAVLHQVMRDAVPRYRLDNPLARPPGHRGNGLPRLLQFRARFLTPQEAETLVRHCPPECRGLVQAALGTGMRLGELLGLYAGAVVLDSGSPTAYVETTLLADGTIGTPKSASSRRAILLSPTMVVLFRQLTEGLRPDELIFTTATGLPWNSHNFRNRFWRTAVAAATTCPHHPNVPVDRSTGRQAASLSGSACRCTDRLHQTLRFQDLRHTHVGFLIAAGWDFHAIQLRLGHASIKTTFDTYGHRLPHGEQTRLQALDDRLPGAAH
jgi:integrase